MNTHEPGPDSIPLPREPLTPWEHGTLRVTYTEMHGEETVLSMADALPDIWVTVTAVITGISTEPVSDRHLVELAGDDKRLGFALLPNASEPLPLMRPLAFQGQIKDLPGFPRVIEVTGWLEALS